MQSATKNNLKIAKPITPKVDELLLDCRSVVLATTDENGNLNASYAPFAQSGNKFYILVSFMSRHTKNLKHVGKASAMFIEDETKTKQIYARDRLTLNVISQEIKRNTCEWNEGISLLKMRHGKIVEILTNMEDFILIELCTVDGSYVNGFGSAYFVDENLSITEHRNDIAHKIMDNTESN